MTDNWIQQQPLSFLFANAQSVLGPRSELSDVFPSPLFSPTSSTFLTPYLPPVGSTSPVTQPCLAPPLTSPLLSDPRIFFSLSLSLTIAVGCSSVSVPHVVALSAKSKWKQYGSVCRAQWSWVPASRTASVCYFEVRCPMRTCECARVFKPNVTIVDVATLKICISSSDPIVPTLVFLR